ncbi:PREDICTED: uncharacterized protein LOC109132626 [Camelina sativa]|uniref:Uncharacterized protein LOC109132626 n=1 Tax=Camelina sativa TaxID=90675 RepID=A0ABM1RLQ0_CAMSA|nr:PREDICTED: uncharacterized protein LOC109132626 [Camelina sativa]
MAFEMKIAVVSMAICLMIVATTATDIDGRIHIRRSLADFGGGCCNVFIHTCCFPKH